MHSEAWRKGRKKQAITRNWNFAWEGPPPLLEGPTLITTDLWKRNRTPLLMHQVPGQTELLQGLALSEVVWQSEHTWSL